MNELIVLNTSTIGDAAVQTVNARDLHAFLEVGKVFAAWFKDRIEQFSFVENQDFVCFPILESEGRGGQNRKEYALTLDMAKELSMVERNAKGKQARQYFIECERKAKQPIDPMQALSDPDTLRSLLLGYADQNKALKAENDDLKPKAVALELISASADTLTFTQAAKVLGKKRDPMTTRMNAEGWVYRQNGSWVAYDKHIKSGNLVYKEASYTDEKTGLTCRKPYCHITQKGLVKLAQMFAVELELELELEGELV